MKKFYMNHRLYKAALPLMFLCLMLQEPVWAQNGPLKLPGDPGETIVLNCDRSVYGISEMIHYSALYRGPGESEGPAWSRVLYVELIHWDGSKQAMSKVLIENNRAEGKITVPVNIPSGIYYLRAYTKWMRNYSPAVYAYIPLKILNPYSKEMIAPASTIDSLQTLEHAEGIAFDEVLFSGLKEQYECGEKAEFEIQLPENLLPGRYSLSIAKTESLSSLNYSCGRKSKSAEGAGTIDFLPEIQGLSLSGRIVDSESGDAVPGSKLQLSSYGSPFFYAEVSPAENGSFLFTLPHFSINPEFHLAAAGDSLQDYKILLEPQYCNKPIQLPYVQMIFDTSEQEIVREILLNIQLKERYGDFAVQDKPHAPSSTAFYGSGATVTKVGDYIEFSSLRECINEIIPQVSIRNNASGEHLYILGPSCLDIYPPLVLLDNVPVKNNKDLLNIPSNRIKRIEVLNQAYMIGEFRYSGIFNIFSNQKDMAGISIDGNGEHYFFNFQLLDTKDSIRISLPDIRNQLYWEPEIEFKEKSSYKVAFSTSDASGSYQLTLRRIDRENGTGDYKKAFFSVK